VEWNNKCMEKLWDYIEKWQCICSCVNFLE
jgi:hypothetical protein